MARLGSASDSGEKEPCMSRFPGGNVFSGRYVFGRNTIPRIELRMGATFGTRMEELIHHLQVQELLRRGFTLSEIRAFRAVIERQAWEIVEAYGFVRIR